MQNIMNSLLSQLRIRVPSNIHFHSKDVVGAGRLIRHLCTSMITNANHDLITNRVISLVKKFNNIDAAKVTEIADFQKDLSLDSLDRVELVMALEQEFAIEIPDEKADKLTSCADVAKYIISESQQKANDYNGK